MANLNNTKLAEAIALLKKDPKNQAVLFAKIRSPEWLAPLAKERFFDQANLPKPIKTEGGFQLPFWPQLTFLEAIAAQISEGKIKDNEVVNLLLEILRSLKDLNDNFIVADGLFKVMMQMPPASLQVADIELAFHWVVSTGGEYPNRLLERSTRKSFLDLKKAVEDNEHDRTILTTYCSNLFRTRAKKADESKFENPELRFFSDYELKEFRSSVLAAAEIPTKPFVTDILLSTVSQNLEAVLKAENVDESSALWRPAIEDHSRNNFRHSAQAMMVEVLYYGAKILLERNYQVTALENWRTSQLWTFRRLYLALFNTAGHISTPEDVARLLLAWGIDSALRHEALQFLKRNFESLSEDAKAKIIEAIDALNDSYSDDPAENNRIVAWAKLRWLSAFKESPFAAAKEVRERQLALTGGSEPEHPDLSPNPEVWVGPVSPFSQDELAKQTIDEMIANLKSFVEPGGFRGATVNGFARTLEAYIPTDSSKCVKLVKEFKNLRPEYVSAIIDGYKKAWEERAFVPAADIVKEATALIESKEFQSDLPSEKTNKHSWVASSICNFSEAGTRDDDNAFPNGIELALVPLLKKLKQLFPANDEYMNQWDAYTRAINEPRGKIFEAMIILALRRARMAGKVAAGIQLAWEDLRSEIEPVLQAQDPREISLYAMVGSYYRQLMFLDQKWVLDNFELLCPRRETFPVQWQAFMDGFSYVAAFVHPIYSLLRDRGDLLHYSRLVPENEDNRINKLQHRAVELSIVAYLLGHETLDGPFFSPIYADRNPSEWKAVVWGVIGLINGPEKEEHLKKAVVMIEKMLSAQPWKDDTSQWRQFFLTLDRFLDYLTDPKHPLVRPIFHLVSMGATGHWELDQLIDYLHANVEKSPGECADLFLELLRSCDFALSWPPEKIRDVFSRIKAHDQMKAIEICRIYAARSFQAEPIKDLCEP